MISEYHQARMRGYAARATVTNLVGEGVVLAIPDLRKIFRAFGMHTVHGAMWDFDVRYVWSGKLEEITGIAIEKAEGGLYYDRRFFSKRDVYDAYNNSTQTARRRAIFEELSL